MTAINLDYLTHQKVCVLLSGGLDSCVLAAELSKHGLQIFPVYIRTGLIWEPTELFWVQKFINHLNPTSYAPLQEISLPVGDIYNSHWSITGDNTPDHLSADGEVYLPGRNLLLLSKTALYCALNQIKVIALGLLKGNPFPDSSFDFLTEFEAAASLAMASQLKIVAPFLELSKSEVIRLGKDLPLELTFSCIHPVNSEHCGTCNKCAERRRSFDLAAVADKTRYHSIPTIRPAGEMSTA